MISRRAALTALAAAPLTFRPALGGPPGPSQAPRARKKLFVEVFTSQG